MMNSIVSRGKKIILSPQSSVLSAASIIMVMVVASRILGLVRQRTIAHFFTSSEAGLFFAAFRLPDLLFEVLVFGTFSSAFIPVFSKALRKGEDEAWSIASNVTTIGLLIFAPIALVFILFAQPIYQIITPGLDATQSIQVANMARYLFAAQVFFVVSYVLTGVLESSRRFIMPALAPIFYNIGIIAGTIVLTPYLGLYGPVIGTIIGAFLHFFVQFPAAYKLGYRIKPTFQLTEGVRQIGRLSLPRVGEVLFQQITKTFELFLASLISISSIAYLTYANTLQLFPVSLFGVPLAKAALPTLSRLDHDMDEFRKTFLAILYQIIFLTTPVATMLIVMRIPAVRLAFGADRFDWQATVQTSLVLSAFAVSIPFQAALALLTRAFYALHDTKSPVRISLLSGLITTILGFVFVSVLRWPTWSLGVAFSVGVIIQSALLFMLLGRKVNGGFLFSMLPILKSFIAGSISGVAMFFILKLFDQSAWAKRLSFLNTNEVQNRLLPFQAFVLDTKYTGNLIILTIMVCLIGGILYLLISALFKSEELMSLYTVIRRRAFKFIPQKDGEQVTPTQADTTSL